MRKRPECNICRFWDNDKHRLGENGGCQYKYLFSLKINPENNRCDGFELLATRKELINYWQKQVSKEVLND